MASNLTDTSLIINGTQEVTRVSTVLNGANTEIITGKAFIDFLLQKKILVVPTSLAVSGDWLSTQYTDTAVNTRGLSFTITYNDGFENIITPTNISPSTWGSTPGTQTATFSYTENGVTVTTTKTATVEQKATPTERKRVGGPIFYIDSTADGTYTFYNIITGQQVPAPAVGDDCKALEYEVSGASKDKYYVVTESTFDNNRWTYYDNGAYVQGWHDLGWEIGTGKTNTATMLAADNGAYINDNVQGYSTIWFVVDYINNEKMDGCDDWYIGSEDEIEQLRLSGVVPSEIFGTYDIWSSSEDGWETSVKWWHQYEDWGSNYRDDICSCFLIRSF